VLVGSLAEEGRVYVIRSGGEMSVSLWLRVTAVHKKTVVDEEQEEEAAVNYDYFHNTTKPGSP
jgi:hypothetical protein